MFRFCFILLLITFVSLKVQLYSVYESIEEAGGELFGDHIKSVASDDQGAQPSQRDNKDPVDKIYEVDAYGPHFTDFGAQTGDGGAFSWHANYPVSTTRYQWRQEWN